MNEPALTVLHVVREAAAEPDADPALSLIEGLATRAGVLQAAILPAASPLARRVAALDVQVRPVRRAGGTEEGVLATLFAGCTEDWDVVHAHDARALRWTLAARALAGGRSPVLATRRSAADERPRAERHADLVATPSPGLRAALVRRGLDRCRVKVLAATGPTLENGDSGIDGMLRCYRVLAGRRPS